MDDTRVKDELHSYVRRDEPPMGVTAGQLVARGRQIRRRRWFATGAAVTAAALALAVVGVPALTGGRVSFDPAGLIRSLTQSPDERIDRLLRANLPRSDEFELKEIKAFRWDDRDPLPKSRLNEATTWQVIYNLDTGNDYIQQIRVILGYYPSKQWPTVVDGCRYPGNKPDGAILYSWGRMSRDLRTAATADEPGYLVSVDAMELGYNSVVASAPSDKVRKPPSKSKAVIPSPRPGGTRPPAKKEDRPKGNGDGGPMTGGYSWNDQLAAATDPDLVFDPPATWPENVESPIPLTKEQKRNLEMWEIGPEGC